MPIYILEDYYKSVRYEVELPPVPEDTREILNYDLPIKEQYWRRNLKLDAINEYYLQHLAIAAANKQALFVEDIEITEEQHNEIQLHLKRRKEGVYMMNNGELVYLTGSHYFMLQSIQFERNVYRLYADFQKRFMYLLMYGRTHPIFNGTLTVKPRRCGITECSLADELNIISLNYDLRTFFISKTEDDGKDKIKAINDVISQLPVFDMPMISKTNTKEILFGKPNTKNVSKSQASSVINRKDMGLNVSLKVKACKLNAIDSNKVKYVVSDEILKYKFNVKTYTDNAIKATIVNDKKFGFFNGISSIGETEDLRKFLVHYKNLWNKSDPTKLTNKGNTFSGLARFCLLKRETNFNYIDIYGHCDIEAADKDYQDELDDIRMNPEMKTEDIISYVRNNLNDIEEAWKDANTVETFDKVNLHRVSTRIKHLKELTSPNYVMGDFKLVGKGSNITSLWLRNKQTHREFKNNAPGHPKWKVYRLPDTSRINYVNRNVKKDEVSYHKNSEFVMFIDQFNLRDISSGKGSNCSAHIIRYADYVMDNDPINVAYAHYFNRPSTPREAIVDCLAAAIYFGAIVQFELTSDLIIQTFEELGCGDLLYKDSNGNKGIPGQNVKWIQNCDATIHNHIGSFSEGVDLLDNCHFEETLEQIFQYNPSKRGLYDAYVSYSGGLTFAEIIKAKYSGIKKTNNVIIDFGNLIKK